MYMYNVDHVKVVYMYVILLLYNHVYTMYICVHYYCIGSAISLNCSAGNSARVMTSKWSLGLKVKLMTCMLVLFYVHVYI